MIHPTHAMFKMALIVAFPSFSHFLFDRCLCNTSKPLTLEEVTSVAAVSQLYEFSVTKNTFTGSDCYVVQNKLIQNWENQIILS